MKSSFYDFEISDDKSLLQIEVIHGLLKNSYWCKDIPIETVERSIENSICFGVYKKGLQIGFARAITDEATFAWLSDVVISEEYRKNGVGQELVRFIMNYPKLQGLRRFGLATRDAHSLYEKFGFKCVQNPESFMEIKNEGMYQVKNIKNSSEVIV